MRSISNIKDRQLSNKIRRQVRGEREREKKGGKRGKRGVGGDKEKRGRKERRERRKKGTGMEGERGGNRRANWEREGVEEEEGNDVVWRWSGGGKDMKTGVRRRRRRRRGWWRRRREEEIWRRS